VQSGHLDKAVFGHIRIVLQLSDHI
jgi:hypothetical protein